MRSATRRHGSPSWAAVCYTYIELRATAFTRSTLAFIMSDRLDRQVTINFRLGETLTPTYQNRGYDLDY